MKRYIFTVGMIGDGNTEQEAWNDAVEGFTLDPGPIPEYEIEGGDEDEEN
ncbi:MAG: hypothetical protein IMZ43_12260 [Thermoplasmata archaeon]|nr:hypothetical protein [Thermoplasmata archaeon]